MSQHTKIEWTEVTWNPITGCSKISPGCKNCYAERLAKRLQAMKQFRYRNGFKLTLQPQALEEPYHLKRSRIIFVNSMSDIFHKDVPLSYIKDIFKVMKQCPQHQFQILTKRSYRMKQIAPCLKWAPNIWMGVSVENNDYTFRIDHLRSVPAITRFVSIEPFIGPINKINLSGINWVIVGGESGPGARPMAKNWVKTIRDICYAQNVPFFFKQWGGTNKKKSGRLFENKEWNAMPLIPQM